MEVSKDKEGPQSRAFEVVPSFSYSNLNLKFKIRDSEIHGLARDPKEALLGR